MSLGVDELEAGAGPLGRVRRPGGGRKRAAELDPGLRPALLALVEPDERGDPVSPLRWTTKSARNLAAALTRQGRKVSADTVGDLLRGEGFSLQGNAKTVEGRQHPDRDAQFRYINEEVKVLQQPAAEVARHAVVGPGSSRSRPSAYLKPVRHRTASAAPRSDRPGRNCSTLTVASHHGTRGS